MLEITHNGLLSDDPTGALIKRLAERQARRSSPATASSRPTAVAIGKDGSVYVSNYGTSAGKGTVVNIGKV